MSMMLGIVHAAAQIMAPYLTMRVTTAPPDGLGGALGFYSLLMMTWTLGLVIIKPTLGVLNDKFGIMWAMIITLSLQAIFFAFFLPNFASLGTVLPFVGMAVGAPIWGLFYDPPTKSYTVGFMLAPVALVIFVVGSVIGMNAGKRRHMALYEEELAAWEASQRSAAVPAS